jgi:hypothetical protein
MRRSFVPRASGYLVAENAGGKAARNRDHYLPESAMDQVVGDDRSPTAPVFRHDNPPRLLPMRRGQHTLVEASLPRAGQQRASVGGSRFCCQQQSPGGAYR